LRILIAAEKPLDGELFLAAPDGSVAAKSRERHGGPPYFWFAEVASPVAGTWHATLARDTASSACSTITKDIVVSVSKPPGPHAAEAGVWAVRNTWNRATENLYSAWIAKLFDAPLDTEASWKAWHEVLRDRSRNFLFNHLGQGEDSVALSLRPDCADFVYFLRAYFAFKMGLPFGYSNCSRGTGGSPPRCYEWFDILHPAVTRPAPPPEQNAASAAPMAAPTAPTAPAMAASAGAPTLLQQLFSQPPPQPPQPVQPAGLAQPVAPPAKPPAPKRLGPVAAFGEYLRAVGDVVHSGSVRTAANLDRTDFYTVALTQETLRPGTVYADPYGHVMMIVQRVPSRRAPRASSSPSTPSRTGRSRESVSGAAISCSCTIRRSAAPVSSASGRSCGRRTAPCARSPMQKSRKIRSTAISRSNNRSSGPRIFMIGWMR
jgi:hypothetical protein